MSKSGFSVKVAWDTSSIQEWFDTTQPLKVFEINSELAMKFRKRFLKGFIRPGANNIYLGVASGNLLFGVLGFQNADYGSYDLLMKADTTPSEWEKSTDLLLFALRSTETKKILEKKFNRNIENVYSMCFSLNQSIGRYRKHGKLENKKPILNSNKEITGYNLGYKFDIGIFSLKEALNAQQLADKDFNRLCKNIKKDGTLTTSVLLMKQGGGGKYLCISGHHRIKACAKVNITEVPALIIDEIPETTRIRLQLTHNDINGESNKEILKLLYKKLEQEDLIMVEDILDFERDFIEEIKI
jgi:hypothetical protein